MKKVSKEEKRESVARFGRRILSGITAASLALLLMGCGKGNNKEIEDDFVSPITGPIDEFGTPEPSKDEGKKYSSVYVKQPVIVDDYLYNFWFDDKNNDGLMSRDELKTKYIYLGEDKSSFPAVQANILALGDGSVYGWEYVAEYDESFGNLPSILEAEEMLRWMQTNDGEYYLMRKLPEVRDNNLIWYYWLDKNNDGVMQKKETYYYEQEIDPNEGVVPAQENANVLAVSDTIFKNGWEVIGVCRNVSSLRNVDEIDEEIKNIESSKKLTLVPDFNC